MIGLDTNVVIRYLVQDDPVQAALATRVFENELSAANKGLICPVVLCEVVWVLLRAYKQKKDKVRDVVRTLLLADNIEIQYRDSVWKALREYEHGTADFSDCLICQLNQAYGASYTLTFDRSAAQQRLFRIVR